MIIICHNNDNDAIRGAWPRPQFVWSVPGLQEEDKKEKMEEEEVRPIYSL